MKLTKIHTKEKKIANPAILKCTLQKFFVMKFFVMVIFTVQNKQKHLLQYNLLFFVSNKLKNKKLTSFTSSVH